MTDIFKDTEAKASLLNSEDEASAPALNMRAAAEFVALFHGDDAAAFQTIDDRKNGNVTTQSLTGTFGELKKQLTQANRGGSGITMAVNHIVGKRRTENVKRVTALFIDVDGNLTLKQIKELKPHLIVETSPSHYHAYWLVRGVKLGNFSALQKALAEAHSTDPNVIDLARVMRLPGTINRKHRVPFVVRVVYQRKNLQPRRVQKLFAQLSIDIPGKVEPAVNFQPAAGDVDTDVKLDEISDALGAISSADDYQEWLQVGMALHNTSPTQRAFVIWNAWSKKSSKYDEAKQKKKWASFSGEKGRRCTAKFIFKLAMKQGWKSNHSTTLPHTSFELEDHFCAAVSGQLCYVQDAKHWLAFVGQIWKKDESKVTEVARKAIEAMYARAKEARDNAAAALIGKRLTTARVKGLLNDASTNPRLKAESTQFDAKPNLLAVENGVVDLVSGAFRLGRPDDYFTLQCPVALDSAADCPKFKKFIDFVTRGDRAYGLYLQHALGYTICGHTKKQKVFVAYGEGGNGKGTLFHTMAKVLGPLAINVAPSLMHNAYARDANNASPAIMALAGGRMLQCTEAKKQRFDEAFLKQISGGDDLSARALLGSQKNFKVDGVPWISANKVPYVDSQDEAMWRRLVILPFSRKFKNQNHEEELALYAEAPGILNWLIQGAIEANKLTGMPKAGKVTRATEAARRKFDSIRYWIEEGCVRDKKSSLPSSVAFVAYKKFCKSQTIMPLDIQTFVKYLSRVEGVKHGRKSTHNEFRGVRLNVL